VKRIDKKVVMDCKRIHKLIDEALFSGEELSGEVRNHLNRCPACRQYFRHGEGIMGIVGTMRVAPASNHLVTGLAQRVIARAKSGEEAESGIFSLRTLFNPRTLLAAASIAGVIFVGLVGYYLMPILLSTPTQWEKAPSMELQPSEGFSSPQYSPSAPKETEKLGSTAESSGQMPKVLPKPPKETPTTSLTKKSEEHKVDTEMTKEKELLYGSLSGEGGSSRSIDQPTVSGTADTSTTTGTWDGYSSSLGGGVFMARTESSSTSVKDKTTATTAMDMLSAPSSTTLSVESFKREETKPQETPMLPAASSDVASLYLAKDPSVPIMTEMSSASVLPLVVDKMKQDSGFPYVVSSKGGSGDHSGATFGTSLTQEDAAYLEDVVLKQISSSKNGSSVYMLINNLSADEKTKVFDCLVK
jgi:hypothetical protein